MKPPKIQAIYITHDGDPIDRIYIVEDDKIIFLKYGTRREDIRGHKCTKQDIIRRHQNLQRDAGTETQTLVIKDIEFEELFNILL